MSASRYEDEGRNLMLEGEKQLKGKSRGFLSSLLGVGPNKHEEAADTFSKAGGRFGLAKAWRQAGEAFMRAAEAYAHVPESRYQVGAKYEEAGKMYRNGFPDKAADAWERAVQAYRDMDPPNAARCGKLCRDLAELYQAQGDKQKELDAYTRAAEFFHLAGHGVNATTARRKIAELQGAAEMFVEAAETFQEIAVANMQNRTLKYSVKEDLLKGGLCWLCYGDDVKASREVEEYPKIDPTFADSREGKLLDEIMSAVEHRDVDAFTETLREYDSISRLDPWKTSMLLKIKNRIKGGVEDEEDLT